MILTASVSALVPMAGGEGEGYVPPTPEIFWQPLFEIGGLTFTNQMAWAAIVTAVLSIVMVTLSRKAAVVPGKGQWMRWPAT